MQKVFCHPKDFHLIHASRVLLAKPYPLLPTVFRSMMTGAQIAPFHLAQPNRPPGNALANIARFAENPPKAALLPGTSFLAPPVIPRVTDGRIWIRRNAEFHPVNQE